MNLEFIDLSGIIESYKVNIHLCTDGSLLYMPLHSSNYKASIQRIQDYAKGIRRWMTTSMLNLNVVKPFLSIFGNYDSLKSFNMDTSHIQVWNSDSFGFFKKNLKTLVYKRAYY